MIIANPIYDIVFKYLMEDERIARTILSALLKKEVIDVKIRRNEYSNTNRDSISIFRIDFGATILEDDGSSRLILIELQKTWIETETLRFRQYLGVHYANPENILPESKEGYAIPMVTVYLLGHKVGDIEEPVLYVRRHAYDYNENLVTKGLPDPFVDSLTHDSIIVQIPRLHGQINNRLDKVLSIFDQSQHDGKNKQTLNIDEQLYANDDEMMRIVHRLTAAAANAQLRHEMNVEDEFFSAIEKRDTDIMLKDRRIAEQEATLKEQETTLKEQETTLKEQETTLKEQETTLKEQETTLKEQETTLKEQETALKEKDATISRQQNLVQSSILMLSKAGMSADLIAANLGIAEESVISILASKQS